MMISEYALDIVFILFSRASQTAEVNAKLALRYRVQDPAQIVSLPKISST